MQRKKIKIALGLCFASLVLVNLVRYFLYDQTLSSFVLGFIATILMATNMLFLNNEEK